MIMLLADHHGTGAIAVFHRPIMRMMPALMTGCADGREIQPPSFAPLPRPVGGVNAVDACQHQLPAPGSREMTHQSRE